MNTLLVPAQSYGKTSRQGEEVILVLYGLINIGEFGYHMIT